MYRNVRQVEMQVCKIQNLLKKSQICAEFMTVVEVLKIKALLARKNCINCS